MKKSLLPVTKILAATVAGIGFASLLMAQPSLAQFNNQGNSFPNVNSDQNTDPFSSNSGNFNPLDLIHRANLGGNLNWNNQERNQQLDSAAADFKARQQKRFQGQQQEATPGLLRITSPSVTPPSSK